MREIQILHLQRSGGHAIAKWLLNLIAAEATFVNDVCHPDKVAIWTRRKPRIPKSTEWLLYNVEDQPLEGLKAKLTRVAPFIPILQDPNPIYILVLRDLYNTLASRWRYHDNGDRCQLGGCEPNVVRVWTQYAKTGFLVQHGAARRLTLQQMFVLNFNRWAAEPAYREAIWRSLSTRDDGPLGQFQPDAHEEVPTWGKGSSFDGISKKSSEMEINERYKTVPSEAFAYLTAEAEFWNEALFGWRM